MPDLDETSRAIGNIEQGVAELLRRSDEDRAELKSLQGRVTILEHDKTRRKTVVTVVSSGVSLLWALILWLFKEGGK